jgi:FkbM family methyltransferase
MTSYSQYAEDVAIVRAVESVGVGRALDLGAFHPTTFSNTRALVEAGWGALLVECSPGPARELIREYAEWPNVEVLVAAVGFDRGHCIKIHATDDAVSTSDAETHEKWKDAGGYYGTFFAPQITLDDIQNQFGGQWDFINFDTEGTSLELFCRAMELGWRPKCACIEHDGRTVELAQHAQAAGYHIALLNGTNMVVAR